MEKMMDSMGASLWGVFQEGTEIEVVESTKGDAFNVYDKRVDRANSELSKLIIGQTMTIEDGSSLSQSQTHLEVFENLVESDRTMLADIVNNQLIPRMAKHGFPVKGLRFEWDDSVDYTPEQQVAFEKMVSDRYEVDPKYFAEKYNMPVGERRAVQVAGKDGKEDDNKRQKNTRLFFRLSPMTYSGLHLRYKALLGGSCLTLGKNDDIDKAAKEWASVIKNAKARKDAEAAARILLSHGIKLPRLLNGSSARPSGRNTARP